MTERLTERDEFGNADIIGVDSEDLQLNLDFEQMNKVTDSLNKLAEYEDLEDLIGIPMKDLAEILRQNIPEDCKHPHKAVVLTDDDVDRWNGYKNAEEQGLLLRLPCKNWMDIVFGKQETFFGIDESYIENPIREITVDSADRFTWYDGWNTLVLNGADENGLDWEFSPEDIGKTVFLTKAEAEQKLKEMESD